LYILRIAGIKAKENILCRKWPVFAENDQQNKNYSEIK